MDTLDPAFVRVLRCPETRGSLRLVPADLLRTLVSEYFSPAEMKNMESWDGALLVEDGRGLYPVRGGIAVLLVEELVRIPESLAVALLAKVK